MNSMANTSDTAAWRSERILEALLRAGQVTVDELAATLNVSMATIRRDLTLLEQKGLLRRTHGGAISVEPMLYEPFRHDSSFQKHERLFVEEKRHIGLAAADLIRDGETIALTPGTTTTQIARSIRHRKGITVVTNAVNIAMELSHRNDLTVFVTGGFLRGMWFSLVGHTGTTAVGELFVDKVFVGVDGIDVERGLTSRQADEATVIRAMITQARRKIVVTDHSKLGRVDVALICPTSTIDVLITDEGAENSTIAPFVAQGIEVIRASSA
jgi:DeoR family transcriptional regulator, aga operon transcriptional repressor